MPRSYALRSLSLIKLQTAKESSARAMYSWEDRSFWCIWLTQLEFHARKCREIPPSSPWKKFMRTWESLASCLEPAGWPGEQSVAEYGGYQGREPLKGAQESSLEAWMNVMQQSMQKIESWLAFWKTPSGDEVCVLATSARGGRTVKGAWGLRRSRST